MCFAFVSLRRRLPRPSLSASPEVPHRSVGDGAQVSSTYAPNKGAVAVPVSFGVLSEFFLKRDRNSGHIIRPSQGSPGRRARNDPGCRRCLHSRYLHCERAFLSVRSTRCNPSANDPQLVFFAALGKPHLHLVLLQGPSKFRRSAFTPIFNPRQNRKGLWSWQV